MTLGRWFKLIYLTYCPEKNKYAKWIENVYIWTFKQQLSLFQDLNGTCSENLSHQKSVHFKDTTQDE